MYVWCVYAFPYVCVHVFLHVCGVVWYGVCMCGVKEVGYGVNLIHSSGDLSLSPRSLFLFSTPYSCLQVLPHSLHGPVVCVWKHAWLCGALVGVSSWHVCPSSFTRWFISSLSGLLALILLLRPRVSYARLPLCFLFINNFWLKYIWSFSPPLPSSTSPPHFAPSQLHGLFLIPDFCSSGS